MKLKTHLAAFLGLLVLVDSSLSNTCRPANAHAPIAPPGAQPFPDNLEALDWEKTGPAGRDSGSRQTYWRSLNARRLEERARRAGSTALGIGKTYQEFFLKDPAAFLWAGMAAFASKAVHDASRKADVLSRLDVIPGSISREDWKNLADRMLELNVRVFHSTFWHHLAYDEGGREEIRALWMEHAVSTNIRNAWEAIDEGRRLQAAGQMDRAKDLYFRANLGILLEEQESVVERGLRPRHIRTLRAITQIGTMPALNHLVFPAAVPGDGETFLDYTRRENIRSPDFGSLEQRRSYYVDSVLPSFVDFVNSDEFQERLPF